MTTRRLLAAVEAGRYSPLRVRFYRDADRIAHEIALFLSGSGWQTVLTSVEGDATDDCPPSPAFQELQFNRIASDTNHGDAVMLVGAAGASRFSGCVSCDRSSPDGEARGLSFDIACRASESSRWLGSTYHIVEGARAECVGGAVQVALSRGALQLSAIAATGEAKLALCRNSIEFGHGKLATESPATIRWRYVVSRL